MENPNYQNVLSLPKEIWTVVFEQFLDKPPNQLNDARLVCPVFKSVIDSMPQRKFQQVLAIVHPYIDRADAFEMRLVAKHCKLGIDMIFEQVHTQHRLGDQMTRPFDSVDKLRTFYESFESSHSPSCNPFPGRSIVVNGGEANIDTNIDIMKNLVPIVTRWGSHLRTIYIRSNCITKLRAVYTLSRILNSIVNVQNLKIEFVRPATISFRDILEPAPQFSTLPELECLKSLIVIENVEPTGWIFTHKMVEKTCKYLESLVIDADRSVCFYKIKKPLEFPNLTEFQFKVAPFASSGTNFQTWNMPQLTRLILSVKSGTLLQEIEHNQKKRIESVETAMLLFVCMGVNDILMTNGRHNFPQLEELIVYEQSELDSGSPSETIFESLYEFTGNENFEMDFKAVCDACPNLESIQIGRYNKRRIFYR